jgi:hypothetical protein
MKERDHLEDAGVDGRITLNLKTWEGKVWRGIHLSRNTAEWWAVVKTAMNVRVTQNAGNFLTS